MNRQYAVVQSVPFLIVKEGLTWFEAFELKKKMNDEKEGLPIYQVTMIPVKNQQPLFKGIY